MGYYEDKFKMRKKVIETIRKAKRDNKDLSVNKILFESENEFMVGKSTIMQVIRELDERKEIYLFEEKLNAQLESIIFVDKKRYEEYKKKEYILSKNDKKQ